MGTQQIERTSPYEEILAFTGYEQPRHEPKLKFKGQAFSAEGQAFSQGEGQTFYETQGKVLAMRRDGFEIREIAESLGYSPERIEALLNENVTTGSPEEVLQESLRTVLSLIPLARDKYMDHSSQSHALALTAFLQESRNIIDKLHGMKDNEEMFRNVVRKILHPFCRDLVKDMMEQVKLLNETDLKPEVKEAELGKFSRAVGIKFQESYRRSTEDLAKLLGVNPDAKGRILNKDN